MTPSTQVKKPVANPVKQREGTDIKLSQADQHFLSRWPAEQLLANNLFALRRVDKELAERLSSLAIPENVHMRVARDGSVSFRFEQPDGKQPWLGRVSIPGAAARINLSRTPLELGNMAMNGIASGYDAAMILDGMPTHAALFVIKPDLLELKLALCLNDFTRHLLERKMIVLTGPAEKKVAAVIEDFYREHPDFAPIQRSIYWNWLSEQDNQRFAQQISDAMEKLNTYIVGKIDKLFREIRTEYAQKDRKTLAGLLKKRESRVRFINCAVSNHPLDGQISRDFLQGCRELGFATSWQMPDRPDRVSEYGQLERLKHEQPDVALLVDRLRVDLHFALPEQVPCITILRQPEKVLLDREGQPLQRMGKYDLIGWLKRSQYEQCRAAGIDEQQLLEMPLAVNEAIYHPVELDATEMSEYGSDVVMIADRPDPDAEANDIRLHSHQALWQAVIKEINRAPADYHRAAARKYLQRAQKCGVTLQDEKLRDILIGLIQDRLGESVIRDIYGYETIKNGFPLSVWTWNKIDSDSRANCWSNSPLGKNVRGRIPEGPALNKLFNAGKIFVHISSSGEPDRMVLNGIASGAFFLIKSHPNDRKPEGISRYLKPDRDIISFDTPKDLVEKIKYFLEHEDQRRDIVRNAREKLLPGNTWRVQAEKAAAKLSDLLHK